MILQKKIRPSLSTNSKISSKKTEFINTINSLNFSIKEIYIDFIKNNKEENSLINSLEKKLDKKDRSTLEIINILKIYIDLDKKAFDDFFEEAKIIFRKMKILFNSLKQYLNDNNQIHKKII
jgi:CO dehydrogenase/acetyl-CoA synthase beta subunit